MDMRLVKKGPQESFSTPLTILEKKHKEAEAELGGQKQEENPVQNVEIKPEQENQEDSFMPSGGIWLKQTNMENKSEEIKIRADKVYKNNLKMEGVTIWFFDKNHSFYKKINAKEIYLKEDKWILNSIIVNDDENINKELAGMTISTNLNSEFILQKIIDNFQDVRGFSIISLPKLINNLEASGFSSRKFRVYFNVLLNYPFLFVCMAIISVYFSINNIRSRNNVTYILCGIIFGLFTYILLNVVNALGYSGILPVFMSTWLVTFLLSAVAILLLFEKESL